MIDLARRAARAHPAILTSVLAISALAQVIASGTTVSPMVRALLTTVPIASACFWFWSVYVVANATVVTPRAPFWAWMFAAPPVIALVAALADLPTKNSPTSLAFFAVLFVVLWFAAQALENADAANRHAPVGRIVVTLFLMFVSVIGVWILSAKIGRVEAKLP
ncbi:hypothetical protein [Brevundimonas subvibrioides]|uniref:hypothetical protein n=1 Tax=Brevundimonas subvibrioides TaxID=74313 RepID=UPI0032D568CE